MDQTVVLKLIQSVREAIAQNPGAVFIDYQNKGWTPANPGPMYSEWEDVLATIAILEQAPQVSDTLARRLIQTAHAMYHDEGSVEVDTEQDTPAERAACISASEPMDGGAYVKAWVWVSLDDLKKGG